MKILVVDDSHFQRNQISKILVEVGCEVCFAENGFEALQVMQTAAVDAVFCDLLMPEMDGVSVLKEARSRAFDIPICIISANVQKAVKTECLELGAAFFFNKPITKEQVKEFLGAVSKGTESVA